MSTLLLNPFIVKVSLAKALAAGETQALALDLTDNFWQPSTGHYGSAYVKDTGTPANNYDSHPYGLLSYTSPSAKMTMGPSGTLRFGAHNLFTYSADISNAAWNKSGCSVSGTTQIVENSATSSHGIYQQISVVSGLTYRLSAEVKAGARSFCLIEANGTPFGTSAYFYINLSNGTITGTTSGTPQPTNKTITSLGGGWYRVTCEVVASASGNGGLGIYCAPSDGTVSYAGDGSSGIYATGLRIARTPSDDLRIDTTSAARYALPFEWDSGGNLLGLLVEEARTNLLVYSEQFDNAAWNKAGASVSANAATGPDGLTTADKLVENSATAEHKVYYAPSLTDSAPHTWSVYAKAAGRSWLVINAYSAGDALNWFDLQNGVVGTVDASCTATISAVGNGWYRCTVSRTTGVGADYFQAYTATANNVSLYAGDGSSGVYIWGAQLEAGAFASSYIPTLGATVTRAADNISLAASAFPTGTNLTIFTRAKTFDAANSGVGSYATPHVLSLFKDISNYYDHRRCNNTSSFFLADGADATTSFAHAFNGASSVQLLATAIANNDTASVLGGGSPVTDTSFTPVVGLVTLNIGQGRINSGHLNGHVSKIMILPRRMSNAELQALTT